jgi:Papain family cysteine protease/Bacterial Ig domain
MKKIIILICIAFFLLPVMSGNIAKASSTVVVDDLPASFNWRDINGTDYTTPIRDQSPAPTCEAFGLCAALETEMQYKLRERYLPDLSEIHLWFNAGGNITKGYVSLTNASNYLMNYGVPDDGCCPDPHRDFDYIPISLPDWKNRTVKITEWGWVDNNITSIKQALIQHGPLVTCISVWEDFMWYFGGVYHHRWGLRAGGHVVAIVGYNDSQQCWIVKNSWGIKWGEKGWFRMSYDANMITAWGHDTTGILYVDGVYGNLKPDVPKVHIETPLYFHTYIAGLGFQTMVKKLPLQRAAARIVGKLTVSVQAENTKQVEFFIDNVSQYVDTDAPFTWDLQTTPGLHTLTVRATDDHNNASLDIEDIYVIL